MEHSKIIISLSVLACITLLVIPTIVKVTNTSKEKSFKVASKKIMESAENCYYEKKCENVTITIKELIEKGFINKIINPKTEEYFNEETYAVVDISSETTLHVK